MVPKSDWCYQPLFYSVAATVTVGVKLRGTYHQPERPNHSDPYERPFYTFQSWWAWSYKWKPAWSRCLARIKCYVNYSRANRTWWRPSRLKIPSWPCSGSDSRRWTRKSPAKIKPCPFWKVSENGEILLKYSWACRLIHTWKPAALIINFYRPSLIQLRSKTKYWMIRQADLRRVNKILDSGILKKYLFRNLKKFDFSSILYWETSTIRKNPRLRFSEYILEKIHMSLFGKFFNSVFWRTIPTRQACKNTRSKVWRKGCRRVRPTSNGNKTPTERYRSETLRQYFLSFLRIRKSWRKKISSNILNIEIL